MVSNIKNLNGRLKKILPYRGKRGTLKTLVAKALLPVEAC